MWAAAPTLQVGVSGGIWELSLLAGPPPLSDSRCPRLLLGSLHPNARFPGGSCERKGGGAHVAAWETGDAPGSFLKGPAGGAPSSGVGAMSLALRTPRC